MQLGNVLNEKPKFGLGVVKEFSTKLLQLIVTALFSSVIGGAVFGFLIAFAILPLSQSILNAFAIFLAVASVSIVSGVFMSALFASMPILTLGSLLHFAELRIKGPLGRVFWSVCGGFGGLFTVRFLALPSDAGLANLDLPAVVSAPFAGVVAALVFRRTIEHLTELPRTT